MRSRSFKKINRALSVLRRTKSGSAVANRADQGRENSENATVPEGKQNPHPHPQAGHRLGFQSHFRDGDSLTTTHPL